MSKHSVPSGTSIVGEGRTLGVIGASNALGARVDWRAYAVIAFWVLENAVLSRWVTRAADFEARVRRSAVTILGDVVLLVREPEQLDPAPCHLAPEKRVPRLPGLRPGPPWSSPGSGPSVRAASAGVRPPPCRHRP